MAGDEDVDDCDLDPFFAVAGSLAGRVEEGLAFPEDERVLLS